MFSTTRPPTRGGQTIVEVAPVIASAGSRPGASWHAGFLALLPRIQQFARFAFRRLDPEAREESVQEVVANAWAAYVRLVELGQDEWAFATVLARYGVAQTREGRRVGGRRNSRDALSEYARKKRAFRVQRLDQLSQEAESRIAAFLEERRPPVPEQAGFRLDFLEWLATLSPRNRRIVEALAMGENTGEVALRFGVTPGRVSQIRRELEASWKRFHGEEVPPTKPGAG